MSDPLLEPCPHLATPAEQHRDPTYLACAAQAGQPCRWARRYDSTLVPEFHTDRLEAAARPLDPETFLTPEAAPNRKDFREAVLATGLV